LFDGDESAKDPCLSAILNKVGGRSLLLVHNPNDLPPVRKKHSSPVRRGILSTVCSQRILRIRINCDILVIIAGYYACNMKTFKPVTPRRNANVGVLIRAMRVP
jgi:hypothetical protein